MTKRETETTSDKQNSQAGHLYPVTYSVDLQNPPLTAEQVKEKGDGACDALIVLSQIHFADGGMSQESASLDGRTGKAVSDHDRFRAWSLMAAGLAEESSLNGWRQELARLVHTVIARAIIEGK